MDVQATMIMTTVDSEDAAARLATKLVERREAACVQQIGIRSRYRWEGEVKCDPEILLLVKTSAGTATSAMKTIEEHHPYEVPEILTVQVTGGSRGYLEWLTAESRGAPDE